MTSFTRKLYDVAPAEAQRIRRQEFRDYRYGKNVTLAQFTPNAHDLPFRTTSSSTSQARYGVGAGLAAPSFGTRLTPPALPAYECWAPGGEGSASAPKPKSIVWAADSFAARKQYAEHHQIAVSEVAARRK